MNSTDIIQKVHQQKQHILFYHDSLPATPQIAFKQTVKIISSCYFQFSTMIIGCMPNFKAP